MNLKDRTVLLVDDDHSVSGSNPASRVNKNSYLAENGWALVPS